MEDRYTVAGVLRILADQRPDDPMLVLRDRAADLVRAVPAGVPGGPGAGGRGGQVGDRVALLDRNGLAYFDMLFGVVLGAVNVAVNWRLAPRRDGCGHRRRAGGGARGPRRVPGGPGRHASGLPQRPPGGRRRRGRAAHRGRGAGAGPARVCRHRGAGSPGARPPTPGTRVGPEEVSVQLYTSGTTGLPKGVMLSNSTWRPPSARPAQVFNITLTR